MEASGGRTGRGDWLRWVAGSSEERDLERSGSLGGASLESAAGWAESRGGDELRTLEDERKDCSKGLCSRLKSVRVWRGWGWGREGSGGGDLDGLFGDIGDDDDDERRRGEQ